MADTPKRRIKTAEKVVAILDVLHQEEGATLSEIADHIGLAKSTTHSYLETLIDLEMVWKRNSVYTLSLKFLNYGGRSRAQTDIYMMAKPQLHHLYEETGHTVHLAIKEFDDLVLLERINPGESVGFGAHIGQRNHFHTPALGKAIMAYLPEKEIDSIISKHGLSGMTDNSITTKGALEDELKTIREDGFATNDEEEHKNYKGIARPILLDEGVKGAVSIAGPKTEVEMEEGNIRELLRSATDRIEIKLQYD